jgi:hypothetical protein
MTTETTLSRHGGRVRILALATLFTSALLVPAGQAVSEVGSQAMAGQPAAAVAVTVGEKSLLSCRHGRNCRHARHHGGHKRSCNCPAGPRGPQGPRGEKGEKGEKGDRGPAGSSSGSAASIDSAFHKNYKYVVTAPGDGSTLVRDPRTTPRWHDLSDVAGYPGDVVAVSAAVMSMGGDLHVTVRNQTGEIAQTSCKINPVPGQYAANPAWPDNCAPFENLTPPK